MEVDLVLARKRDRECPHCRHDLHPKLEEKKCPYCGKALMDEALAMSDADAEEVIEHLLRHEDWQ